MENQDKKRFGEIVSELILKNYSVHGDMKKAKKQAFDRLNDHCPEVLSAWLGN